MTQTLLKLNSTANITNLSSLNKRAREFRVGVDTDLVQLFSYIKTISDDAYFFESLVMPEHQDRYFTIGYNPALTIKASGDIVSIDGSQDNLSRFLGQETPLSVQTDNPYRFLQSQFKMKFKSERHRGGLIGYTAYEAVNHFGFGLKLEEHEQFGSYNYGLYIDGFIYDSLTGVLSFYTYDPDFSNEDLLKVKDIMVKASAFQPPSTLKSVRFDGNSETREQFIAAVERTQQKIKDGYSFQSEVGFKSHYTIDGDKFAIYNKLREINPSPYMYYIKSGSIEIMGASPEILVSSHDRDMLTTPTAGTIKRGSSAGEDRELARTLLSDPKEIAEHNMLVDLHRNDMGMVAEPGTVKIKDLMYLIKFSHVQHIVSDICARQSKDKDAFDVLAAIMPGGVVTGAPKIETMKIIDDNEGTPRGIYGGAVGRFSFNGDCDFCLPIRSIFCVGDECYAQTSAGVVYDSVPEKEYDEVVNKLAAMKQTLEVLGGTK